MKTIEEIPGPYLALAKRISNPDGDTIRLRLECGPDQLAVIRTCRLVGVDDVDRDKPKAIRSGEPKRLLETLTRNKRLLAVADRWRTCRWGRPLILLYADEGSQAICVNAEMLKSKNVNRLETWQHCPRLKDLWERETNCPDG